ncbi:MAG TPA: ABC transporter permease [Candidatus Limnocylindria bacterium]|nr:ABC transporter permease [Candidatus Limnocylindria bacterium]
MNLFPNAWHVARREYAVRVRTRPFVITTLILAAVAAIVVLLPTILDAVGVDDPPRIGLATVDVGELPVDPAQVIALGFGTPEEPAEVVPVDDVEAARQQVRDEELDFLIVIERGADEDLEFELFGEAGPVSETRARAQAITQQIAQQDRLARIGLSEEERAVLTAPVAFEVVSPDEGSGGPEGEEFGGAYLLGWAVLVLTFMAILTYGNWVAQSVAEEKSNRVMELLITAATPRQLLAGKVIGTGAAGLTQYVVVLAVAAVAFVASEPIAARLGVEGAGPGINLPDISPFAVLAFTLFFFGGFLLYSTLYAAAGSMVSRIEDVQQASGPLLILAMGGYFAAITAINVPDAEWVATLSLVPFFSPYLMPIRMLLGTTPGVAEIGLALGLLAVTIVIAVWVAARIYSAGVLLYGQRVGLRNVLRATRVAR